MILLISASVLILIFGLGWLYATKIRNASIVDVMWALSLPIPVMIYLWLNQGWWVRELLLLAIALIWSLRLGLHLLIRIRAKHPQEDPRYAQLREHWNAQNMSVGRLSSARTQFKFLVIFMVNAGLVFALSQPFYAASAVDSYTINLMEIIGVLVFAVGLIGETVADSQLKRFSRVNSLLKKQGEITSTVCKIGLWKYSRHPNYFFEAVIWLGIYLFSCTSILGMTTIYAPVLMVLLLTKVTGIPPLEKLLIKSKGDAYRRYQETTSSFIPWFPKSTKFPKSF